MLAGSAIDRRGTAGIYYVLTGSHARRASSPVRGPSLQQKERVNFWKSLCRPYAKRTRERIGFSQWDEKKKKKKLLVLWSSVETAHRRQDAPEQQRTYRAADTCTDTADSRKGSAPLVLQENLSVMNPHAFRKQLASIAYN